MKTAISIPDNLFKSADSLAKRLKVSRSKLYSTALADLVARYQGNQITSQLNALYSEEDSAMSPRVMALEVKSLQEEDW